MECRGKLLQIFQAVQIAIEMRHLVARQIAPYPGLRTNNSKETYAFSDFSYPVGADMFPYAEEVRSYLESYADHFDVRSKIQFNQEVVAVNRASDDNRLAVTCRSSTNEETTGEFDFVAVCNGVLHIASLPAIAGMDEFAGRILHSSEVTASTYQTGDNVIVVGGGKSAFDCATWAAKSDVSPTLVYRRPQWMAPRFLPGGRIPGDLLLISRLMALFLRYYHSNSIERFLHGIGKPIVRLWWGLFAFAWPKDLKMPPGFKPAERLPAGLEKIGVGGDFYAAVNDGTAAAIYSSIERFTRDGVELAEGRTLPADVVVFATGWKQDISFLGEELRGEIAGAGYFRLFRQILAPTVPNIGFVGYASSFACQLTAEIGAHWLSEHFHGTLRLPPLDEMNEEINRAHKWADEYLPNRGAEGFVGPYVCHYVDDLVSDIGLTTRRLDGFFAEYLTAFRASRFAGLGEERRRKRTA